MWKSHPPLAEHSATDLGSIQADHGDWLLKRLSAKYGPQDAEDLLQETWLRIAPYTTAERIDHPKALLLTIASNIARNMGMMRVVRRGHAAQAIQSCYEQPSQLTEVLAQQLLLGLPVPLRDVFVLSRIVGLSNAQIAEQLGISPKTVEGRMTKALAHCAAQLRR